ncbi:MAG: hypothetical protein COB38_00415 [Gammaproteobacteria bacterium]|nr:MAG: hypothetical protein COB38_00415 [Gammaproteobacteria bacterium]
MKHLVLYCFLFAFGWSAIGHSQPWINTSELSLRADIETLTDIGIISVPISTYPLMWSGIIKEFDNIDINNVPSEYKSIFWRVKKASKRAFSNIKNKQVQVTLSNSEKVLRSFGDKQRGKLEIRASSSQVNKNFAWNLEVARVTDPSDGETSYYEGSYISSIVGNWVFSLGHIEKWWGASWDSANLLSNNAKTPLGFSISRNYANQSDVNFLKWLGRWNVSAFVSKLEKYRYLSKPIFSGISFSTKLTSSLETSLRFTRLSVNELPLDDLPVDNLSVDEPAINVENSSLENSSLENSSLENSSLENKNQRTMTELDLRWSIPYSVKLGIPTNIYASVTDEGYNNYSSQIFGISSFKTIFDIQWRAYLEYADTSNSNLEELSNVDEFALANSFQVDGSQINTFQFKQRAIGSTYGNQSKAITLGVIGNIDRYQNIELKLQSLKLNESTEGNVLGNQNTFSFNPVKTKRITIKWHLKVDRNNQLDIGLELNDKIISSHFGQNERYRAQVSWTHFIQ